MVFELTPKISITNKMILCKPLKLVIETCGSHLKKELAGFFPRRVVQEDQRKVGRFWHAQQVFVSAYNH